MMKLKSLHYVFSKKPRWGSKLIAWGSNKHTPLSNTPAHIALLINGKWVIESTYSKDVACIPYGKWKEINIETHKLKCNQERNWEQIRDIFKNIKGKKYDWYGIGYFVWRFLLLFLFRLPLPITNRWEKEDRYFCCEAVGKVTGCDYSMKTPAQLYLELEPWLK